MIKVGDYLEREFLFSEEAVKSFAISTGDHNPIHLDSEFASNSIFKERIVHSIFVSALISAVFANELPGTGSTYLQQNLAFKALVFINDRLKATVSVRDTRRKK